VPSVRFSIILLLDSGSALILIPWDTPSVDY